MNEIYQSGRLTYFKLFRKEQKFLEALENYQALFLVTFVFLTCLNTGFLFLILDIALYLQKNFKVI